MRLLVFAGAGTSIELGVPGMVGLGEEFLSHAKQWDVHANLVKQLLGESRDIEHLIEELDRLCSAGETLRALGAPDYPLDRTDKIRAEVEWFVQHAAERIVARDAHLIWGPLLRIAESDDLTIVTTNYDRAIELAANAEHIPIEDGFEQFGDRERASWVGFQEQGGRPLLVKLHGSTDWYAADDFATPTKLRHPMPLFGRASLRLADGTDLGSALVLPSREKLLTRSPYPRLSQMFLNAADHCEFACFVGSSLRDHHVRDAAAAIAKRVPIFLINPKGDTFGVEGAMPIKQCASTFLIATLQNALVGEDPIATLKSNITGTEGDTGVLHSVRLALDADADSRARCRALDELDSTGMSLDIVFLRRLLCDGDATVARYALGLIPLSTKRLSLLEEAAGSLHAEDPAFQEDLGLLREMLAMTEGNEGAISAG